MAAVGFHFGDITDTEIKYLIKEPKLTLKCLFNFAIGISRPCASILCKLMDGLELGQNGIKLSPTLCQIPHYRYHLCSEFHEKHSYESQAAVILPHPV